MVFNDRLSRDLIFNDIDESDIDKVLQCLSVEYKDYKKNETIISLNDDVSKIGIITNGEAIVYKNYLSDELTEVKRLKKDDVFGVENIYSHINKADFILEANKDTTIMYIDGNKLTNDESLRCKFRVQMNKNFMEYISKCNLYYQNQIEIRSICHLEDRVLSYLKMMSKNKRYFNVIHNRYEMAMYLGCTRPALSKVLSNLKKKNIIDYHKNVFILK